MVSEYVYSPHGDFFIDRVDRAAGDEMASFQISIINTRSIMR